MNITSSAVVVAALLAAAPLAVAAAPSTQDVTFARLAARGGMAEVGEATLAERNGSSPAVRAFARTMIADHGKANDELMSIARSENIALPSTIGPVDAKMKGSLEGLHGTTFDTAYLQHQHLAHVQTAASFKKEIATGSDAKLVAFAKAVLPTVDAHLALDQKDLALKGTMTAPAHASMKKPSM